MSIIISKFQNNKYLNYLNLNQFIHNKNLQNLENLQRFIELQDLDKVKNSLSFEGHNNIFEFQGGLKPIKKSIHIFIPDKSRSENHDLISRSHKSFQNNSFTHSDQNKHAKAKTLHKKIFLNKLKNGDKLRISDDIDNNFLYKLPKVSFVEKRSEYNYSDTFQIKQIMLPRSTKSTNSILLI